jgi:hypothetical protein
VPEVERKSYFQENRHFTLHTLTTITIPSFYNIVPGAWVRVRLLHEDDGGDDVGDEAGEGDDTLDHALDPKGEDLDQVMAILAVL